MTIIFMLLSPQVQLRNVTASNRCLDTILQFLFSCGLGAIFRPFSVRWRSKARRYERRFQVGVVPSSPFGNVAGECFCVCVPGVGELVTPPKVKRKKHQLSEISADS